MTMNGLTFPDLPSAVAFQVQIDAKLGYPKSGVDVGSGVHAPPSQSATLTYMAPVQLATVGFGFPVDAVILPVLTGPQTAAVATINPNKPALVIA